MSETIDNWPPLVRDKCPDFFGCPFLGESDVSPAKYKYMCNIDFTPGSAATMMGRYLILEEQGFIETCCKSSTWREKCPVIRQHSYLIIDLWQKAQVDSVLDGQSGRGKKKWWQFWR